MSKEVRPFQNFDHEELDKLSCILKVYKATFDMLKEHNFPFKSDFEKFDGLINREFHLRSQSKSLPQKDN